MTHRLTVPVRETSERTWLLRLIGSQPFQPRIDADYRKGLKALRLLSPVVTPTDAELDAMVWPDQPAS